MFKRTLKIVRLSIDDVWPTDLPEKAAALKTVRESRATAPGFVSSSNESPDDFTLIHTELWNSADDLNAFVLSPEALAGKELLGFEEYMATKGMVKSVTDIVV